MERVLQPSPKQADVRRKELVMAVSPRLIPPPSSSPHTSVGSGHPLSLPPGMAFSPMVKQAHANSTHSRPGARARGRGQGQGQGQGPGARASALWLQGPGAMASGARAPGLQGPAPGT